MKRKVIQIANSTQLISLPMEWAKQHNIKKGDELEVEIKGKDIVIKSNIKPVPKIIDLDITGLDRTTILHLIRGLYRKGFDEMNFHFSDPLSMHYRKAKRERVLSIIYQEVSRLTGLEIIKQTDNFCGVKCISEPASKEFEPIMERVFLLMRDLYNDFQNAVNNNDKILMESIEEKHFTISKFISYCARLLNKQISFEPSRISFLHHILAHLDCIIDFIKYSARDLISYKSEVSNATKDILKSISESFTLYFKFFYGFDFAIATELNENREHVKKEIIEASLSLSFEELHVLHRMEQTLELLLDCTQARMSIESFKIDDNKS